MSDLERGLTGRVVGFSLALLLASIALTVAVDLLRAIWPWLLATLLVIVGAAAARWHRRRW